eukprot:758134-Hanusia_phi.AAC.3
MKFPEIDFKLFRNSGAGAGLLEEFEVLWEDKGCHGRASTGRVRRWGSNHLPRVRVVIMPKNKGNEATARKAKTGIGGEQLRRHR